MAYDKKFKTKVMEYHNKGNTIRDTAKVFDIPPKTISRWLKDYRTNGDFTRSKRIYKHKISEEDILKYLNESPSSYQYEMAKHFNTSQSTINV